MEEPEDEGPRYRLVMFVAIAAIVVPGFLLLNWIGENGVSKLFSDLLGLQGARPRVTRTATPTATATATPLAITSPTTTPAAGGSATLTPPTQMSTGTATAVPPTRTAVSPTPIPTKQPAPSPTAAAPTPTPPPASPTPRPSPTATPAPETLGYGTAVPAYGGAAVIRQQPTTESEAVGSIPLGERVLVFRIVEGEAIDPVESRWWEIEYAGVHGYVYYKLIRLD